MTVNRKMPLKLAGIAASLWLATASAAEVVSPHAVSCKLIKTAAQLQAMKNNLAGSYCLANDIDAASIANFVPIGDAANPFTGKFFGNGRVIRNLTIDSGGRYAGLFGAVDRTLIQDVGIVNADIASFANNDTAGGLVGYVSASNGESEIRRVHVTGRVAAVAGGTSYAGGIVGYAESITLADSWSSASVDIAGEGYVGGAIGSAAGGTISRVYATGPVTCPQSCRGGGLIGYGTGTTVVLSYASGPVTAGDSSNAGGLVGRTLGLTIQRSHALGAVTTGAGGNAGGLVGYLTIGSTLAQVYAIGRVAGAAGATVGGLVGEAAGMNTVTNAYWDINTSAQAASAAGIGYSTSQLRAVMPIGFGNAWAITAKRSYPFLNEADIDFAAPLAMLVKTGRVYTFLPISQRDRPQYSGASTGANFASLATVYTMIARAIGITRNVAALKDVPIDRYWKDATKTAVWKGPVTTRATLGELKTLAANARLNNANVIGEMKVGRLVMLRGSYTRNNGAKVEHWLLGTLYTTSGNVLDSVIANDPWTGMQVMIDPSTKKVVSPAAFPLANFKVDGYRPVTLN